MEYKILREDRYEYLEKSVNDLLADGWQLHGGPLYSLGAEGPQIAQAMVRTPNSVNDTIDLRDAELDEYEAIASRSM